MPRVLKMDLIKMNYSSPQGLKVVYKGTEMYLLAGNECSI